MDLPTSSPDTAVLNDHWSDLRQFRALPEIGRDCLCAYRTVAWLLGISKNTVQRIFQLKGWQVRKRPVGARPRIEALPSVAEAPNERWSTDMARVWAGKDGWATLALVMDCHTRELLGWHLSRSGKASTAAAALEHALIARFGSLGRARRRSFSAVTMGWSSRPASTPLWCEAMV